MLMLDALDTREQTGKIASPSPITVRLAVTEASPTCCDSFDARNSPGDLKECCLPLSEKRQPQPVAGVAALQVGRRVSHATHGLGTVMHVDMLNERGRPFEVLFDCGSCHQYSAASAALKLTHVPWLEPPDSTSENGEDSDEASIDDDDRARSESTRR